MLQLNLLPDVKQEYIRTTRNKRMVLVIALTVSGACFAVMTILFLNVNVLQRKHLSDLNGDIAKFTKELQGVKDLDKILTVQNQLQNLPKLHQGKPAAIRLADYMKSVTPADASIASLNVDFTASQITIGGSAKSLGVVNKFVDTLKFTDYKEKDQVVGKAFSQVVLGSFNKSPNASEFSISFKFDPVIFDNTRTVSLLVPNIITTRSEVEKPDALFQSINPSTSTGR